MMESYNFFLKKFTSLYKCLLFHHSVWVMKRHDLFLTETVSPNPLHERDCEGKVYLAGFLSDENIWSLKVSVKPVFLVQLTDTLGDSQARVDIDVLLSITRGWELMQASTISQLHCRLVLPLLQNILYHYNIKKQVLMEDGDVESRSCIEIH